MLSLHASSTPQKEDETMCLSILSSSENDSVESDNEADSGTDAYLQPRRNDISCQFITNFILLLDHNS